MPSTSKSAESTALSIRPPGNLDLYYHESGSALAERALPTIGLLALIPSTLAIASVAVYRDNAASLTFGFSTSLLAIAVNVWWFWWMQGYKELIHGLKEAENSWKLSEKNLEDKVLQMDRDNDLHHLKVERETYETESAKLNLLVKQWEYDWVAKVKKTEKWANKAPDLKKLWDQAKEDADAAVQTHLTHGERESKQKKAEESITTFEDALDDWVDKAQQIHDSQTLTPVDYHADFWDMISGESGTSSRKVRRSRIPHDRLPNLVREYCFGGVCNRMWYSNSQQGSGRRTMAASEITHKVYLTPIDYDIRTPVHQKREVPPYQFPMEDVECDEEEDYEVDGKPLHASLELKGGNIADLEQITNYVTSDQADAVHVIGELIEKGPKVRDEDGNGVTIIARKGWMCISLDTPDGGQPAIWGLYGLFEDPTQLHADRDKEWDECKNKLHA
ncbi:uncharacterized protein PFLUO_LOCUS2300 [Penicillium psychrofluorescens]|uniref:uncharacterized protein n=1 Tax=Penicillium psychrofluorescens TaxID=3158075 RepID=UPI003CCDFE6E